MDVRLERHLRESPLHAHGILELVRSIVSNNYYARAYRSAQITGLTASAWTTIVLDAESEDANSCFNTATGIYTVKASGLYHVDYGVRLYVTAGTLHLGVRITHDGATTRLNDFQDSVPTAALGGIELGKPGKLRLNLGDQVRVQYYSSSASCNIIQGEGVTWMAIARLA